MSLLKNVFLYPSLYNQSLIKFNHLKLRDTTLEACLLMLSHLLIVPNSEAFKEIITLK